MEDFRDTMATEAQSLRSQAMRAAEGFGVAQDWNAALDCLQRAAELGNQIAQAELAALSGDWSSAHAIVAGQSLPPSSCETLRRSIDLGRVLTPPRKTIVSASPRIAVVEAFVAAEVCDWLIERARPLLVPAQVYDHDSGLARSANVRTNSECHITADESDFVLLSVCARIAAVTGLPVTAMEATTILHYTPGQRFEPHHDYLDTGSPGYAKEVARGGQRVLTFLLCLNDDYEGGETDFPMIGKRYKGHKGNALFFWNVEPDGQPDMRTLHAGLPPTRGEKWLLSQWIRGRVARA
jgi:prolyl 4-hydroxylase